MSTSSHLLVKEMWWPSVVRNSEEETSIIKSDFV